MVSMAVFAESTGAAVLALIAGVVARGAHAIATNTPDATMYFKFFNE